MDVFYLSKTGITQYNFDFFVVVMYRENNFALGLRYFNPRNFFPVKEDISVRTEEGGGFDDFFPVPVLPDSGLGEISGQEKVENAIL